MDRIIWIRLVPTALWVISTPTGGRVEPDVYCRCETSSTSSSTGTNSAPTASGIWSITTISGSSKPVNVARNSRTSSTAADVVNTTDGRASRNAVSRRSAWPGSSGANSGTAMSPAFIAPKNPTM